MLLGEYIEVSFQNDHIIILLFSATNEIIHPYFFFFFFPSGQGDKVKTKGKKWL